VPNGFPRVLRNEGLEFALSVQPEKS
jgi:hypothetical protein